MRGGAVVHGMLVVLMIMFYLVTVLVCVCRQGLVHGRRVVRERRRRVRLGALGERRGREVVDHGRDHVGRLTRRVRTGGSTRRRLRRRGGMLSRVGYRGRTLRRRGGVLRRRVSGCSSSLGRGSGRLRELKLLKRRGRQLRSHREFLYGRLVGGASILCQLGAGPRCVGSRR